MCNELNSICNDGLKLFDLANCDWMPYDEGFPHGCVIKKITTAAQKEDLSHIPEGGMSIDCIHLYVDGGFKLADQSGSWSVLVCSVDKDLRHQVMCTMGNKVSFDPTYWNYVGADAIHSTTTECVAHLYAFMFLYQPVQQDIFLKYEIKIGYDNISAAKIANGTECTKDNPILVHLLSAFYRYLIQQIGYKISFYHIHSHHDKGLLGHPWNEGADAICTHYMKHDSFIQNPFGGPVTMSMAKSMDMYSMMVNNKVQACLEVPEGPPVIQKSLPASTIAQCIDNDRDVDIAHFLVIEHSL